ncbi:hypothetical protein PPL_11375 [Heterostelium album PN500]|uniref:Peptidoglycan binding-like domain-containing protein n=1 Tax=Heterostelium pallidum (strain ATCC 26659 / Pp 5 / PN500) TaxID=670386 RepID=D3BT82_HETP5|nr:hypothetical protein PPL_11375 [Heterostelium album PN500]EFA75299.1 hypothetical protein PPL_11375 [Heterostelium album PN500]|eukprot:XP_020427433.1 hypothetical protein PPL_11375 [Heterostelium album PN500]
MSNVGNNASTNPNPRITDDERRLLDSMEDSRDDSAFLNDESVDQVDPIEMELRRKMLSMLTTSTSQGGSESTKHQPPTRANILKKLHTHQTSEYVNNKDNNNSINLNSSNNSINTNSNNNNNNNNNNIKDYYNTNIYNDLDDYEGISNNNNNNNNNSNSNSNSNNNNNNNNNISQNNLSNTIGYGNINTNTNGNASGNGSGSFGDSYVTCERYRIAKIADEFKWDVVEHDCVLKEYRLYAVEEWIFKSSRLWSAVEYTGNQSDQIYVSVVRPTRRSTSETNNKQLQNMLSKAPSGSFYTIRTPLGQLVLANSSVSSHFGLNLIPIPNGDFDRHIETLKLNLLLKRLGCTRPKYQLSIQPLINNNNAYEKLRFESLANANQTNLQSVTNFVKEIQAALSHLNYLPLLTKIDGQYDQKLINAVKAFQTDFNKRNNAAKDKDQMLQVEGYIDQNTFKGIVTEIMSLRRKIESLGFKTPDNPIKNYIDFNELMKSFQDSYGIYPDAPGKNILTYLENINKMNQHHHQQQQFYYDSDDDENDENNSVKSENILDSASSFSETESSDGFNLPSSPIPLKNKSVVTSISTPTSDTSRHSSPSMIAANVNQQQQQQQMQQQHHHQSSSPTTNSPFSSSPVHAPSSAPHGQLLSRSNKGIPTALTEQSNHLLQQQQQHQQHGDSTTATSTTNTTPYYNEDIYEYFESVEDAEEKMKLKETIVKLEKMMEVQQTDYDKLKQEFETLSEHYADMKEQAARSMAIISTNEKLFQEIYNRWGKTIRKELPEIEEKINLNVDTIQSCSNRIKRLEDIVISVQKKNERNIFTIITSSLLSIVSLIAVGFAYLIMFFSGLKRKWYPSSKPKSSSEEIQRFISKQKIKISELIEDLDYNEDNDKVQ